jgi:signal transduction histidine kinase
LERNAVALRALRTQRPASATVLRDGVQQVDVAVPLADGGLVLLLTAPLADAHATVRTVERRMLAAGFVALVFAAALGFGAATLHARRIERLRAAADRIAHGDFEEPVVDRGSDELGDLARSFEQMRGRLSALDHARREFVANASHELRTPLFAVDAALELLEDEELDEQTRDDFIHTMREQVDRLTRLAGDLLDLSRLDAGRLPVEPELFDLSETAAALAREFDAAARTGGHELALESNGAVPALADPDRVLRIGRALLENAIVHTPAGTPVLIRTERIDGVAVLEVVDEGPGIPPEEREQVFDRFYRVGGERASGSGLGLAIARELAEVMGGSLSVDSPQTRSGARFRVRLPGG